jgi:hypothetical protein
VKKEQIKSMLLAWRDRTVPTAGALVADLFKSADRVLLEYADKAESNAVQAKFFEGQRELWLKQDQVVSQFHDVLFHELFQFTRPAKREGAPGEDALKLVSKDAFERSLALQTISDQALKRNHELYYALSQRLGVVTHGRAIPLTELPAGPHQLAAVFERCTQILNVEREVLLALFTLFEREVLRNSPPWHEELNESLRDGGILPNLKYAVTRQPGQASPAAQAGGEGAAEAAEAAPGAADSSPAVARAHGGAAGAQPPRAAAGYDQPPAGGYGQPAAGGGMELGDEILGRIRELLSAHRARQGAARGVPLRPEPAQPAPTASVMAAIDSPAVQEVAVLPETGVLESGARQVTVSSSLLDKVRGALSLQRAQIKEKVGRDKLSHFDEDTIDIVGMLFEVMLNDKRLGNTVKALLSHLHTPYLKLAVRDRAFLEHREHPARRLFDQMVEAGTRWVDERDLTQGLYPQLQSVVERIVRAKDHPVQLFQELEDKLSKEIKQLSEKQKTREARTLETEKGKARLEEARAEASRTTLKLLEVAQAPARYQAFITGPWTDYLTLLYLRNNGSTDTGMWRGAMVLGERMRAFIDGLATGARPSGGDLKSLRDELGRRLGELIPQYQTEVERLFEVFSGDYEPAAGQAAPAAAAATAAPEIELTPNGEKLMARLPQLPPGTWVVFHEHGEADHVVKLSWFNSKTQRFLFVDQTGAKALAMPLRELADCIDRERAHVLHASGTSYVESSLRRAMQALEKRA